MILFFFSSLSSFPQSPSFFFFFRTQHNIIQVPFFFFCNLKNAKLSCFTNTTFCRFQQLLGHHDKEEISTESTASLKKRKNVLYCLYCTHSGRRCWMSFWVDAEHCRSCVWADFMTVWCLSLSHLWGEWRITFFAALSSSCGRVQYVLACSCVEYIIFLSRCLISLFILFFLPFPSPTYTHTHARRMYVNMRIYSDATLSAFGPISERADLVE